MGKGRSQQAPTDSTMRQTNLPEYADPYFRRLLQGVEDSTQPYQDDLSNPIYDDDGNITGFGQMSTYMPYQGERIASSDMYGDIMSSRAMTRGIAESGIAGMPEAMEAARYGMDYGREALAGLSGIADYQTGDFSSYDPTRSYATNMMDEFQAGSVDPYSGFQQTVVNPYADFNAADFSAADFSMADTSDFADEFQAFDPNQYSGFQQAQANSMMDEFQAVDPTSMMDEYQMANFSPSGEFEQYDFRDPMEFSKFGVRDDFTYSGFGFDPTRQFGTDEAARYMSPYMQAVVEDQKSQAIQDFERQAASRDAAAVQAGAFGGSRQAVQEALAEESLQDRLGSIGATGAQAAFQEAQQQFERDRAAQERQLGMEVGEFGRVQAGLASEQGRVDALRLQEQSQREFRQADEYARSGNMEAAEAARVQAANTAELARTQAGIAGEMGRVQAGRVGENARMDAMLQQEAARTQAARAAENARMDDFMRMEMGRVQQSEAAENARMDSIMQGEAGRVQSGRVGELGRAQGLTASELARVQGADAAEMARIQSADASEMARIQSADASEMARIQQSRAAEMARIQSADAAEMARIQQSQAAELARTQGISVAEAARIQQAEAAEIARTQGIDISEAARIQAARTAEAGRLDAFSAGEQSRIDSMRASELARIQAAREASRQFGAGQGLAGYQAMLSGAGQYAGLGAGLAGLGERQRAADIQGAQLLETIGRDIRAEDQGRLDLAYEDFLRQRNYPMSQYERMAGILRGVPVTPDVEQQRFASYNPIQQALGAGISGLGLYKGLTA